MNKIYLTFTVLIFSLCVHPNNAFGTTGGPTYIQQIGYKASNNSVYYIQNDYSGKGCPPVIHSVNVTTLKDIEVKTCDQVFQEFFSDYSTPNGANEGKYNEFISATYANISYMGSVSLKKNNIDVQVEFLSEYKAPELDDVFWREFVATITQDDKEIAKMNFRGCAKDQPHIFEGYMIPNSDAMAVLLSNKGDCVEGGYVNESLTVIKGIKYYDKNIVRNIKELSATEPNIGNLTVYAMTNGSGSPEGTSHKRKNKVAILVGVGILGIALGYIAGRKRKINTVETTSL